MAATATVAAVTAPSVRRGVWALSAVEASAFAATPQVCSQWPLCRRLMLRLAMVSRVATYERLVNEDGTALCLLRPRRTVQAACRVAAGLVLGVAGLGLAMLWVPLFWVAAAGATVLTGPCALLSWRARPMAAQLKAVNPAGDAVYVHSVASVERGSGAAVMSALVAEADRTGSTLVLDAGCDRLVRYYSTFDFGPVGPPVPSPWGESVTRMARWPEVSHG
jgi:hypothetical protein